MDVVQLVRDGKGRFEWFPLETEHDGHKLMFTVMRDAMKFDGVPDLTWDLKPVAGSTRTRDGVRLPATAIQLQQVADLVFGCLLTPKVVDLLWAEAGRFGAQFDSIVNVKGNIVATSKILDVHDAIEEALSRCGGDEGGIIDSVGKYWVLVNLLLTGKFSKVKQPDGTYVNMQAVNYGWPTITAGNGMGVTGTVHVWQKVGDAHNYFHFDPSQTIRLMHRSALLVLPSGSIQEVDVTYILQHPTLWPLLCHDGPLNIIRQPGAEILQPQSRRSPLNA